MNQTVWNWKGQRPQSGLRSIFSPRIPWLDIDWHVVVLGLGLVATSVVFVNTMDERDNFFGRDGVSFASHVKKLVVALPFLFLGFSIRPRWVRRNAWLVYVLAMGMLILVPIFGEERNHARRWIQLPMGFDLQPSELAKLGLVVILASVLYRNRLQGLLDYAKPAVLAFFPMVLVAAQPDLGTALTIVPITLGMCWLAGARARVLLGVLALGCALAISAYQFEWVQGYQHKRIETWLASLDDDLLIDNKNGAAFHAYQSRVCIGGGGLWGKGLGGGVANEAGHLPERTSDSIFAVIAEELGFLGTSLFILGYVAFGVAILAAAGTVRERFSRLLTGGVGLYFLSHFFINVGVNLGLLPMTGLPLPLISTGGSSLLASFLALGLALGLSSRHEPTLDLDAFRG